MLQSKKQNPFLGGEFRGNDAFDEAYLSRFLRVHHWKPDRAAQAIKDHAVWRSSRFPLGRITPVNIPVTVVYIFIFLQDEIKNELAAKKMYIQGLDREGRAVAIFLSAKHDVKMRDPEEMERMMCYTIDKQLDMADVEINPERRITIFFDLSDVSVTKSIDLSGMHHLNNLMSHHYVMRLGKLYVYNAPMLFWATWKAFSVFIPKEGLKMIHFLYPKDLPALHEEIPPEILPKNYRGKGTYVPVQDT